jgi:hypothetical protein
LSWIPLDQHYLPFLPALARELDFVDMTILVICGGFRS